MHPEQKILVIDPNSINRKLIQGLLEKQGYVVTPCERIDDTAPEGFDLVISDTHYYGQFGSTLNVLYLAEDTPDVREVLPLEVLLFKPITPQSLFEKIAETLPRPKFETQTPDHSVFNEGGSPVMQRVFDLVSELIEATDEAPHAAIITKDGEVIAEATDRVIRDNDPTAKAALEAIKQACHTLKSTSLAGCEIYLMAEPCPLCLSAIYTAELDKIYFANTLDDMAEAGLDVLPIYDEIREPASKRYLPSQILDHAEGNIILQKWQDLSR